jgi:putative drug exporter of the RND superfamily
MTAIFVSGVLDPDVSVKQIGLGMAVAVVIDATVVRMILVPAVMELCGRANWWMPGRRTPTTTATPPPAARVDEEARV